MQPGCTGPDFQTPFCVLAAKMQAQGHPEREGDLSLVSDELPQPQCRASMKRVISGRRGMPETKSCFSC